MPFCLSSTPIAFIGALSASASSPSYGAYFNITFYLLGLFSTP
nr:MAG TPA: hypothetical protein [Caudoviricetes sp.]